MPWRQSNSEDRGRREACDKFLLAASPFASQSELQDQLHIGCTLTKRVEAGASVARSWEISRRCLVGMRQAEDQVLGTGSRDVASLPETRKSWQLKHG